MKQIELIANLLTGEIENTKWGMALYCPVCRDANVHIEAPIYTASDSYGAWDGRGCAIRIPMYCERNHTWVARLGLHKGVTFLAIEQLSGPISIE